MIKLFICSALYATFISISCEEVPFQQDTYLNALHSSHTQDNEINGYDYARPNNNKYLPPTPIYGPPAPAYGPPAPVYGPPAPVYGPPPFYKPSELSFHSRDDWLWKKIKTKINLFTIGKIILKLLIFKKIIKFIGLICLLLFLPKLKGLFKDDMMMDEDSLMDSKEFKTDRDILAENIDELYKFAVKSFASYQQKGTANT